MEWTAEKLDALKEVVGSSFSIVMNANDFFAYATAYAVDVDTSDLSWILPIVEKYSYDGLNACLAYIEKAMPIPPWLTEKFMLAHMELVVLDPKVYSKN